MRLTVIDYLLCRGTLSILEDNKSLDRLPLALVGDADGGYILYLRKGVDNLLHFTGRYIEASPNNDVFFAIRYRDILILVFVAHVTGVKPSASHRFDSFMGRVVVPLCYDPSSDDDLPHLPWWQLPVPFIKYPYIDPWCRRSDRAGFITLP